VATRLVFGPISCNWRRAMDLVTSGPVDARLHQTMGHRRRRGQCAAPLAELSATCCGGEACTRCYLTS